MSALMRAAQPGWVRIGLYDKPERRALWCRIVGDDDDAPEAIELCAGREGDDAFVRLTPENPQWEDLCNVFLRAEAAARDYTSR